MYVHMYICIDCPCMCILKVKANETLGIPTCLSVLRMLVDEVSK